MSCANPPWGIVYLFEEKLVLWYQRRLLKERIKKLEIVSLAFVIFGLDKGYHLKALAKAEIALKIHDLIKKKKLTQAKAAKLLKISQPKISLLLRGYLTDFSLERLLRFLNDLGQDVYISIVPSSHRGHGSTMIGDSPSNAMIAALAR
jgi:predicted XRE-type DNA-binding protein